MISEQDILELIKMYLETPAGKSLIKDSSFKANYNRGYGETTKYKIWRTTQDLIDKLYHHMTTDTVTNGGEGLSRMTRDVFLVTEPYLEGGLWHSEIFFNFRMIHRTSLYRDKYPNGLKDIIKLFTHGYNASNQVFGVWKGHESYGVVGSLTHRDGVDFLGAAVREFNDMHAGFARAEVLGDYR